MGKIRLQKSKLTSVGFYWILASFWISSVTAQLGNLICGNTQYTDNTGLILSPGFNLGAYPANTDCNYKISIGANQQITVTFLELDIEDDGSGGCYDSVKIVWPDGSESNDVCGTSQEPLEFRNSGSAGDVEVKFSSDDSEQRRGFRLSYEKGSIDPCTPNPCQNGGTCMALMGMVRCACAPGWSEQYCDADVNECETGDNTCSEQEICVNTEGSYTCTAKESENNQPGPQPNPVLPGSSDFNADQLFVDEITGNPCRLSDQGRELLTQWLQEYQMWRSLLQDYTVKYQQWKNDECPEN